MNEWLREIINWIIEIVVKEEKYFQPLLLEILFEKQQQQEK